MMHMPVWTLAHTKLHLLPWFRGSGYTQIGSIAKASQAQEGKSSGFPQQHRVLSYAD